MEQISSEADQLQDSTLTKGKSLRTEHLEGLNPESLCEPNTLKGVEISNLFDFVSFQLWLYGKNLSKNLTFRY